MSKDLFSYTRRDYESLRKEGLAKLPILSNGRLTDLNASDPGVILIDYLHSLVDMVQFYLDHQALETFLVTAKERSNVLRLSKQFGYSVRSAKGARVLVRFVLPYVYDAPFMVPKYTRVSTQEGIEYLVLEDTPIPAGISYLDIECVQGTLAREFYTGTSVTKYTRAGETVDQTFLLSAINIDIDTIVIEDSIGRIWTRVENLVHSDSDDLVYSAEILADGSTLLRFGDGIRGVYPRVEEVLVVTYIHSLGEQGRVGAGKIRYLKDDLVDQDGETTLVTVINMDSSLGGSSAESEESIKDNAPGVLKSQYRAVTIEDFEVLAKLVDGVRTAKAYDINNAPDLCLHHEVKVLVVPEQDTEASILKGEVTEFLRARMVPCNLTVLTPRLVPVNVRLTIQKNNTYTEGSVEYEVSETVKSYFDSISSTLDGRYNPNDLLIRVGTLDRVRSVESISPSIPVSSDKLSVIKLGTLTIEVI